MDGDLAHLRAEYEALDADDVADVEHLLHQEIVIRFILARTDVVAADVDLDASGCVLQHCEQGLAHVAYAHDPAGIAQLLETVGVGVEAVEDLAGADGDRPGVGRIGLVAVFLKFVQLLAADLFLLVQFHAAKFSQR